MENNPLFRIANASRKFPAGTVRLAKLNDSGKNTR
jgi:hypothetical protein